MCHNPSEQINNESICHLREHPIFSLLRYSCMLSGCSDTECPSYCQAPEAAGSYPEPEPTQVTTALDIWAAGCLLYGLLAGRAPFGSGADSAADKIYTSDSNSGDDSSADSSTISKQLQEEAEREQEGQLVEDQHLEWVSCRLCDVHWCRFRDPNDPSKVPACICSL